MPFDFHCRYGLFTYAQSANLDHWAVLGHFTNLGAECIIAQEDHADGGTHLHVFADWGRRKRFRNQNFADVLGFHPNISPSRGTPAAGWDYATKDGNVIAGGLARPADPSSVPKKDQIWDIILDATTREQFFTLARELAPSELAKSFSSLQKYADWRYAAPIATYDGPTRGDSRFDLSRYPELDEWVDRFCKTNNDQSGKHDPLLGPLAGARGSFRRLTPPLAKCAFGYLLTLLIGRGRSLVLFGGTRLGKSTWARGLGEHLYFGGLFSGGLALANSVSAEYAVFDDIRGGIKFFPGFKDWLGCQPNFMVKQLYREPVLMKWGKPSIWISNTDPRLDLSSDEIEWMEGNCLFVNVTSPIFHANTE